MRRIAWVKRTDIRVEDGFEETEVNATRNSYLKREAKTLTTKETGQGSIKDSSNSDLRNWEWKGLKQVRTSWVTCHPIKTNSQESNRCFERRGKLLNWASCKFWVLWGRI